MRTLLKILFLCIFAPLAQATIYWTIPTSVPAGEGYSVSVSTDYNGQGPPPTITLKRNGVQVASGTVGTGWGETAPSTPQSITFLAQTSLGESSTRTLTVTNPLPPPATSTTVGTLPGSLEVSSSGNSGYQIPLEVVPGSGGFEPSLSLVYSSGSRDSYVGYGWSLGGLSNITRTGSNTYLDELDKATFSENDFETRGVQYNSNDRFALDGNRLVMVGSSSGYGSDGKQYRTEIDTFAKVTSHGSYGGGPTHFTVKTKDGMTLTYGGTSNSRMIPSGKSAYAVWAVSKMEDVSGNTIEIEYQTLGDSGALYPKEIKYSSGLKNSVKFEYAAYSNPTTTYSTGSTFQRSQILTDINMYEDGAPIRGYALTHTASSTDRWRLDSIELSAGGVALPPTHFEYENSTGYDYTSLSMNSTFDSAGAWPAAGHDEASLKPIDLDGDGRNEIIKFYRYGATLRRYAEVWEFRDVDYYDKADPELHHTGINFDVGDLDDFVMSGPVGDFNGDGRSDFIVPTHSGTTLTSKVRFSQSDKAVPDSTANFTFSSPTTYSAYSYYKPVSLHAPDMNGDGRSDFLVVERNESSYLRISSHISTGSSFSNKGVQTINFGTSYGNRKINVFDFNGDGMDDIVLDHTYYYMGYDRRYVSVWTSNGDGGFVPFLTRYMVDSGYKSESQLLPVDLNGDGLLDFVYTYKSGSNVYLAPKMNKGTTLVSGSSSSFSFSGNWNSELMAIPGEVDGDGRGDILYVYRSGSYTYRKVYKSRGSSFDLGDSSILYYNWKSFSSDRFPFSMDMIGNGKTDLVVLEKIGDEYIAKPWIARDATPDLLTLVENGLGEKTAVRYAPLSLDGHHYNTTVASTYPTREIRGGYMAVDQVLKDDGIGATQADYVTEYLYTDARTDQYGRGFLGMRQNATLDVEKDFLVSSSYSQEFPHVGVQTGIAKWFRNHDPNTNGAHYWALAEVTYPVPDYKVTNSVGGYPVTYFPYVKSSRSENTEVDDGQTYLPGTYYRKETAESTYDTYGNLTQNITRTYDQAGNLLKTLTTDNVYNDDVANWRLGRLDTSTVKHDDGNSATGPAITRKSEFEYDSSGRLWKEIVEPDSIDHKVTTVYGRDSYGNVTSESITFTYDSVSETRTTSYGFDSLGRYATSVTNPKNHTASSEFNKAGYGLPTKSTDANSVDVLYTYDSFGRPESTTNADLVVTTKEYLEATASGLNEPADAVYAIRTTSEKGGVQIGAATVSYLDRLGRELRVESRTYDKGTARTVFVDTVYDDLGQVEKKSDPYVSGETVYWTTTIYDNQGRPKEIHKQTEDSGTIKTRFEYDQYISVGTEYGEETTVTSDYGGKNQMATTKLNALGQKVAVVDNMGEAIGYVYDDVGNLKETIDPDGNKIEIGYDSKGYFKISMDDPDMGYWEYEHDALGQLREQKDAKLVVTTFAYDKLGRVTSQQYSGFSYSFTYDNATGAGIGSIASETGPNSYFKTYTYDSKGRVLDVTESFNDIWDGLSTVYTYTTSNQYDGYGRLSRIYYPDVDLSELRYYVENTYDNATGVVKEVKDSRGKTWWSAPKYDAQGRVVDYKYGDTNGIRTVVDYEDGTGFVESIKGYDTNASNAVVQNWSFGFDNVGNLTSRTNSRVGKSESYVYDSLNRLDKINGVNKVDYDRLGNITWKFGVGSYQYNLSGPHAVSSVNNGTQYVYDNNGNITSYGDRSVSWTAFNKPHQIYKGTSWSSFQYGSGQSRIVESSSGTGRKHYAGGVFERVFGQSSTSKLRHFIPSPVGVVGVYENQEATNDTTKTLSYFHKDHLGSVVKVSDEYGTETGTFAYGVWGEPVNTSTWTPLSSWDQGGSKDRGFTGHEMLDDVRLVHMNGRIYDPVLGKFLSPDTFVQSEGDLQNYNRYSYVLNNPLSYTDPSGHFITLLVGIIANMAGLEGLALVLTTAAAAAAEALIAGGDLGDAIKAFAFSAISAGISTGVGDMFTHELKGFWHEFGRAAAHGATQGALTSAQGGDFMAGFASAFVSSSAGSAMGTKGAQDFFDNKTKRAVAAAVVGGTTSELSGGSFANGAVTGAFIQMFNHDGLSAQDKAAKKALEEANELSIKENVEYGGFIYEKDGEYGYTEPQTEGLKDTVNLNKVAKALVPDGARIVGDYHTHGDYSYEDPNTKIITRTSRDKDNMNSDFWSDDDIKAARFRSGMSPHRAEYKSYLATPSGIFKVIHVEGENKSYTID